MDRNRVKFSRAWKGAAKKLVCGVSAAAVAVMCIPAAAFATDTTSTYYDLPTADQVINFQHKATDADGHEYEYEYVSIGNSATGRVAPMMQTWYEFLGLNYINAYSGPGSIFADADAGTATQSSKLNADYTSGSTGKLTTRNSTLAIIGSSNNESPDEYIWNYCCWANGASVNPDARAMDHGNSGNSGSISLTIDGAEYANFPREVYYEVSIIAANGSTATYGDLSWLEWIELENKRADRPKTGTYDPAFATYGVSGAGGATMVKTLHTMAETIDSVIAESADKNGNYTLQSRYGGNSANGTGNSINAFEDLVQATQYYTLSKIADKTVKKAVTAVLIGYDPETGNYAVRKQGTDKDPDGNQYGGRVINYSSQVSTNITDLGLTEAQKPAIEAENNYVAWYTPEQIVANCDACFVCDAYSANTVSTYLATASDGKCYTVYTPVGVGKEEEDNTEGLVKARNAAKDAGKAYADFLFSYPANMFGNFYAQGVENGMLAPLVCAFTYPSLFNLTDMLAYWVKNVWHVKDSSLQSILTSTCAGMDLASDEASIGKISSNYAENAEKVFTAGNTYYLSNMSTIDAINNGNLKTYDASALALRTIEAAQKAAASASEKSAQELAAAKKQIAQLKASIKTVTINKATVKNSDVKKYTAATTVVLGAKVKKISANTFKGTKVKTVIIQSKKLKKAKVKNCFKSSKVTSVQVPASKQKAYKKFLTKKVTGKKVKFI